MNLTGLQSRCQHGYILSRGSRGELLFVASGGCLHALAHEYSLHLQSLNIELNPSCGAISLTFFCLPLTFKHPCDYI